jgi:peptide subunit release factor 1 (eRF1)
VPEVVGVSSRESTDRLRVFQGGGYPVLSVYLGLRPGYGTLAELPTRLKELLANIYNDAMELSRPQRMSLRTDVDAVYDSGPRVAADLGRGVAIFRCSGAGLNEYVSLPRPVRDRAIVDATPYLRPLDAVFEADQRLLVVVPERRRASLFRFHLGQAEELGRITEEEIRKRNWGGFSGYEERRVRSRADGVAARHYRVVAKRVTDLARRDSFDILAVGGQAGHVDGLVSQLSPELASMLAGTFVVDPGTMTKAVVREHAARVAEDHLRERDVASATRVLDLARSGGAAAYGIDWVLDAVNRRAVETLFVQGSRTTPGAVCRDCGWIMSAPESSCPSCSGSPRMVPDVLDAMAESVLAASGTVKHVLTATPLVDYEVAALLRYR